MPPRLKSLELLGYKTFASKTYLEFPGMITAIVGPNGSGKSNITDGLRWVLGEQSYSLLRGKKTEDMIFTGSEQRARAGMAACTIVFDNADGWLPIDYSEVAITRRAYRDGQNEYLLNGQKVRLKDIGELLAQSGLSERTYAIIGQGLIDNSLALRPEERRKLFEEAAGIGLYRSRRMETINRLEVTRRNMERVKDILAEIEPRMSVLEKQAKKAEEYERLKADLKLVLREWYGYYWHKGQEEITQSLDNLKRHENLLEQAKNRHEELNVRILDIRSKIQSTRANLDNWHGQLSELYSQKESNSRQMAANDERSRSLQDQVHAMELEVTRYTEEISADLASRDEIIQEIETIQSELNVYLKNREETSKSLEEQRIRQNHLEKEILSNQEELSRIENGSTKARIQIEEKTNRINALEKNHTDLQAAIQLLEEADLRLIDQCRNLEESKNDLDNQLNSAETTRKVTQKRIEALEVEINILNKERVKLDQDITRIEMEIGLLDQAENSLVGYPSGAKSLLQSIRTGGITGLSKALSSQLIVPETYEAAINAAMGEYLDAVLLQQEGDTRKALELLDQEKSGRTALITRSWIKPQPKISGIKHPDMVGIAIDLINYPKEYSAYYEVLLNRVVIVTDRKAAVDVLPLLPEEGIAITLKGEIFYRDGRIIGGTTSKNALISRPRQRKDLQERREKLIPLLDEILGKLDERNLLHDEWENELKQHQESTLELSKWVNNAANDLQQAQISKEKNSRQLEWSTTQLKSLSVDKERLNSEIFELKKAIGDNEKVINDLSIKLHQLRERKLSYTDDTLSRELAYLQTNIAVNQRALDELNKRVNEKQNRLNANEKTLQMLATRIENAKASMTTLEGELSGKKLVDQELIDNFARLQSLIDPAQVELKQQEAAYNELLTAGESLQSQLNNAEKFHTQAQMDLIRKKEHSDTLRKKIEDDFGLVNFDYADDVAGPNPLPFEGMIEQLPTVKVITTELEENITRQKSLLRRMGSINPEAKEEFESTRDRFEFLTHQTADLMTADENLRQILLDLDTLMKSEFKKTFDAVASEFPKMFTRLFGGGSARLLLSDPDDLNESGIEIHARLPGKREQELTLLSGGERSLAAVALIFALLKVSPTPFCVLDEVDAMLDESNVGRFRDLLLELSADIQFLLVTHNRNTVQAANVIYGVTMGRDSSSQMVSLRLDEVPDEMLSRSR